MNYKVKIYTFDDNNENINDLLDSFKNNHQNSKKEFKENDSDNECNSCCLASFFDDFYRWQDQVNRSLNEISRSIKEHDRCSNSTKKDLEAIIASRNREINDKAKVIKELRNKLENKTEAKTLDVDINKIIDSIKNAISNFNSEGD